LLSLDGKDLMSESPLPHFAAPQWASPETAPYSYNAEVIQRLRAQVLRIVVLAVAVVAILGLAAVWVTTVAGSWAVLIGACLLVCGVIAAAVAATRAGSAVHMLGARLQTQTVEQRPPASALAPVPAQPAHSMFGEDPDQRREVFSKLARRLQSLVNRAILKVDTLEREIEDPELLKGLFEIDHLDTLVRRQAENLAVLGGDSPQRRSNTPVPVYAVLRSAVAEIEHYKQVTIVAPEDSSLHGHFVAEIIHLLAELLENATTFTPDARKVTVNAQRVTAGLAIEVQDRGLGMPTEERHRFNRLLDGTATIDLGELLQGGRIGLAVVKELARRHDIRVQLQPNIFGGTDAVVVLPDTLLSDAQQNAGASQRAVTSDGREPVTAAQPVAAAAMASSVPSAPSPSGRHGLFDAPPPPETYSGAVARNQLPVRRPGTTAFTPATPVAPRGESGETTGSPDQVPPPLPQRRGSYLADELRQPPPLTTPLVGHDVGLMANIQRGFERAQDARETGEESSQSQHGTTQGESTEWPRKI
jgi:signal transduction histidine kinase